MRENNISSVHSRRRVKTRRLKHRNNATSQQICQPTCRPDRASLCVKHAPICAVEGSHIPHVHQEAVGLHHVLEGGPAQLQGTRYVLQHNRRLCLYIVFRPPRRRLRTLEPLAALQTKPNNESTDRLLKLQVVVGCKQTNRGVGQTGICVA